MENYSKEAVFLQNGTPNLRELRRKVIATTHIITTQKNNTNTTTSYFSTTLTTTTSIVRKEKKPGPSNLSNRNINLCPKQN